MAAEKIHLYIGLYDSVDSAEADFDDLKALHESGRVGAYDAAVLTRDGDAVTIAKRVGATRHGLWSGVGVGVVVGVLFPPSILGTAAVGGGIGALTGHFSRGLSKADAEEAGTALRGSDAALMIVGDAQIAEQFERVLSRARPRVAKEIDADPKAFTEALREAEAQRAEAEPQSD
jgi:uncharacterized membrane protein